MAPRSVAVIDAAYFGAVDEVGRGGRDEEGVAVPTSGRVGRACSFV